MEDKIVIMNWDTYCMYSDGETIIFIDRIADDVTAISKSTKDMETAIMYYDELRFHKIISTKNVNPLNLQ